MSSIKDVAKLAGVSYTTVSHVINATRFVHPETEKKVRDAIAQCGFTPSQAARSLRCGKSRTIGIIDATPADLFFMETLRHAQRLFDEEGYTLYYSFSETYDVPWDEYIASKGESCAHISSNNAKEREYIDQMVARDVEAIIINPITPDDELTESIASTNLPFVLFQRSVPESRGYGVVSDDFSGGNQAISYLVSLGHRKIAVVHGCAYESNAAFKRHDGILHALRDAEISIPEAYCEYTSYLPEEAYAATCRLLALAEPPTAIFYYSDIMAYAGIRAIKDQGLDVPRDISVIGYDNIQMSDYFVPRVTTINQDKKQLGELLARTTLECIESGAPAAPRMLPVSLVVRESCASPRPK